MIDTIKNLTYQETKEYLHNKTDEEILNLFDGTSEIDLQTFIKMVLCIKDSMKRHDLFYNYIVFYDNIELPYFLNHFDKEDLVVLGYDFLRLININNSYFKILFTTLTNNTRLILVSFNRENKLENKVQYIKNIHLYHGKMTFLEKLLINKLEDNEVKFLLNSNNSANKKKQDKIIYPLDIDPEITFGFELELINDNIQKFINIPCLMENFTITKDGSVVGGLEVVSPIFHYETKTLNQIKNLCNMLSMTNFTTNDTCSFHVHIGADYLKTKEDYLNLLYLYFNTEDIIYKITDRSSTQKRLGITKYASKLKGDLKDNFEEIKTDSKDNIISSLKKVAKTRYRGLNLQNINNKEKNTIEFRMSNGELEFDELLANIRLFLKIIEVSHQIKNKKDKYALFIMLGKCKNERKRLELLLTLLFDKQSDRDIYFERYDSNQHNIKIIEGSISKDNSLLEFENQKLVLTK